MENPKITISLREYENLKKIEEAYEKDYVVIETIFNGILIRYKSKDQVLQEITERLKSKTKVLASTLKRVHSKSIFSLIIWKYKQLMI
jgi:hypothetical protein